MKAKVIFRKFKTTGNIVAIFPEFNCPKYTFQKDSVMCYTYIGQRDECNYKSIMKMTGIAKKGEYDILIAVLTDRGYDLEIVTQKEYEKSLTIV